MENILEFFEFWGVGAPTEMKKKELVVKRVNFREENSEGHLTVSVSA